MGGTWQLLVMLGLHWGLIPLFINEIVTTGSSGINALVTSTPLATAGVVLAIYLKTKDKNLKSIAVPAIVSSFCGVSEPAIYGITLPRKKPFFITLISAGIGGAIIGSFGSRIYVPGGMGVFKIPTAINPEIGIDKGFYGYVIALIVAFVTGFILTWFFGFSDDKDPILNKKTGKKSKEILSIKSPLKGKVVKLENIEDEAFSKGIIGNGLGIDPVEGKVYSPFDGELTVVFPTGHALGMKSAEGTEILIHIGMDTVKLDGEGFKAYFKQGDKVKKGDLLVEFDIDFIKGKGYSLVSPVVITNADDGDKLIKTEKDQINYEDELLEFIKYKNVDTVSDELMASSN
jgi:PTS system beta-glucosides-specific IIC component